MRKEYLKKSPPVLGFADGCTDSSSREDASAHAAPADRGGTYQWAVGAERGRTDLRATRELEAGAGVDLGFRGSEERLTQTPTHPARDHPEPQGQKGCPRNKPPTQQ